MNRDCGHGDCRPTLPRPNGFNETRDTPMLWPEQFPFLAQFFGMYAGLWQRHQSTFHTVQEQPRQRVRRVRFKPRTLQQYSRKTPCRGL